MRSNESQNQPIGIGAIQAEFPSCRDADRLIQLLNAVSSHNHDTQAAILPWLLTAQQANEKFSLLSQQKPQELLDFFSKIPESAWNSRFIDNGKTYTIFGWLLSAPANIAFLQTLAQKSPEKFLDFLGQIPSSVWKSFQYEDGRIYAASHSLFLRTPVIIKLLAEQCPERLLQCFIKISPDVWEQQAEGSLQGITVLYSLLFAKCEPGQEALQILSLQCPDALLAFFHNHIPHATWAQEKRGGPAFRGTTPLYWLLTAETLLMPLVTRDPNKLLAFFREIPLPAWNQPAHFEGENPQTPLDRLLMLPSLLISLAKEDPQPFQEFTAQFPSSQARFQEALNAPACSDLPLDLAYDEEEEQKYTPPAFSKRPKSG